MKRTNLAFSIVLLLFLTACAPSGPMKDFSYGFKELQNVNFKYNTTMESYPGNLADIKLMESDLKGLKNLVLDKGKEPFILVVDYRLANLEAEQLYFEGMKYSDEGIASDGFGCMQRPLILESSYLRNQSANKGSDAIDILREFIKKYPIEAELSGLSEKNALFANATFYQIGKDAKSDARTINSFCPANSTLVIYQRSFKSKTNLTDDEIAKLNYNEAVKIYKKIRGFE